MTSSLVGSEMCIRDRRRPNKAGTSLFSSTEPWYMRLPSSGTWIGTVAFDPVSYTHLTLPTICSV
eukprot:10345148-Prorocentrum_lima.AAC.1